MFVLYKWFKRRMVWWEYAVPFVVAFILIVICVTVSESVQTRDIEYWGGYVQKAEYFEAWDERVSCQHPIYVTDSKGNLILVGYQHAYDVDDHEPYWVITDSNGATRNVNELAFLRLVRKFGNKQFVELSRDYHSNDGDCFVTYWGGDDKSLEPTVDLRSYVNMVQASSSILNFRSVNPKTFHLFDYPEPNGYTCPVILGRLNSGRVEAERQLQILNSRYGASKKVRVWLLIFHDKPYAAALDQEAYWKGGNKNEFIVIVGLGKGDHVSWCKVVSWTEQEVLKARTKQLVSCMNRFDPVALAKWLTLEVSKTRGPIRKDFRQFSYLSVEPPTWMIIVTFLLTIVASAITSFILVINDYSESEHDDP
jgi:hypothetical protein